MDQQTIINRITAEILHQSDIEGIRNCVAMAYSAGVDECNKNHSNRKRVARLDSEGEIIKIYESTKQAARILGGDPGNIALSARTGKWKALGSRWKYV